jgi:predicted metal-dependent HD superfamily phosphohydrolase
MPPLLRALLVERFGASPLAYHNLGHIEQMLGGLDRVFAARLSERDARVLRYAIWLHDAFYDAQAKDNERRSADIGLALLQWPEDELRDFETCVMATQGHATDHALAQMLVDLDLSILASERDAYRAYALAIRDEYRIYPDAAYRAGRVKVLDQLCAVPLLRVLSPAQGLAEDALEQVARANMRWEQERLRGDADSVEAALVG